MCVYSDNTLFAAGFTTLPLVRHLVNGYKKSLVDCVRVRVPRACVCVFVLGKKRIALKRKGPLFKQLLKYSMTSSIKFNLSYASAVFNVSHFYPLPPKRRNHVICSPLRIVSHPISILMKRSHNYLEFKCTRAQLLHVRIKLSQNTSVQ